MSDLTGKVALVTGGGRGLGAATALALAEAGADVAIMARDTCELTTVADLIRAKGRSALGISADVSDWPSVHDAIEEIREELGPISILVNNAAVSVPFASIDDAHPQEWAQAININLTGAFYCTHAVLADMIEGGWGRVINVSSGAAVSAGAASSAYSASKAGLDHFTRVLAAEMAATSVAAIIVYPGIMETQMQVESRARELPEAEIFRQFYAKGLLRPPEESAALIRWLCGPDGEYYRGQVAHVHSTDIRAKVQLPELAEEMRRP